MVNYQKLAKLYKQKKIVIIPEGEGFYYFRTDLDKNGNKRTFHKYALTSEDMQQIKAVYKSKFVVPKAVDLDEEIQRDEQPKQPKTDYNELARLAKEGKIQLLADDTYFYKNAGYNIHHLKKGDVAKIVSASKQLNQSNKKTKKIEIEQTEDNRISKYSCHVTFWRKEGVIIPVREGTYTIRATSEHIKKLKITNMFRTTCTNI
eukprot:gene11565-4812_t